MKLFFKDILILSFTFSIWLFAYFTSSIDSPTHEALKYFPMHFIITVGYYAIIKVCFNILNIKDCTEEYNTLLREIDEAREYYTKKGIKYN
jgi:hypothetical protein